MTALGIRYCYSHHHIPDAQTEVLRGMTSSPVTQLVSGRAGSESRLWILTLYSLSFVELQQKKKTGYLHAYLNSATLQGSDGAYI